MKIITLDVLEGDVSVLTIDKIKGENQVRYRFKFFLMENEQLLRSAFFADAADCICLGKYLYLYYERFKQLPPEYEEFKR